jgi:hypothetical protein
MMVSNDISSLLFILFVCIIIRKYYDLWDFFKSFYMFLIDNTYSYENSEQETSDDNSMDTYISKHKRFINDQHVIMKRPFNVKSRSSLKNIRSDSAETYFNWAEKTQRK